MTTADPTWQLVLAAAQRLHDRLGEFRLQELIVEVQRQDPSRGRESIQPVVQGMTANAGKGPPSPCGKPLRRVGHGMYTIGTNEAGGAACGDWPSRPRRDSAVPRVRMVSRDREVHRRLEGLTAAFGECVAVYDRTVPFGRVGQFEKHRLAIDRRLALGGVVAAINDDYFVNTLYQTLQAWGIGRRASYLVPLARFREVLTAHAPQLSAFTNYHIEDPAMDARGVADEIWSLIESLPIVDNISRIVPGTKTVHHLLPDLVPPMDRAWTGAFFRWSVAAPQSGQRNTFVRTFTGFAHVAGQAKPSRYVGDGWRTSATKVLDNAMIGYCKTNHIAPAHP